jgi:hypothetical protein
MMIEATVERLWTEQEFADYIVKHIRTVRGMRKSGEIPPICWKKIGGTFRYIPDEVRKWEKK